MSVITFLDNNTSYEFAKFLDVFIKAGMPIFSLFSTLITIIDWKIWKSKSPKFLFLKWCGTGIIYALTLFCIICGIDGRYTETEVGDHGNTSYYYFGKAKNSVRFGFGKLFDENKNIYMISDAKGNETYGNVKRYSTEDGITYLSFEGTLVDGKREGYGIEYALVNGERYVTYDGDFHKSCHMDWVQCQKRTE